MNRMIAITIALVSVIVLMAYMGLRCSPKPFITEDRSEARRFMKNCEGVVTTNEKDGVYRMECNE